MTIRLPIQQFSREYQYLAENHFPVDACLHGTAIAPESLKNPENEITQADWLVFYSNILQYNNNVFLGTELGSRISVSLSGAMGYGQFSAADLHQAIHFSIEFQNLSNLHFRYSLELQQQTVILCFSQKYPIASPLFEFLCNLDMAGVYSAIREICMEIPPLTHVKLMHNDHTHLTDYEAYFNCPVSFNAPRNEIQFEKSWINTPLIRKDPEIFAFFRNKCELLNKAKSPATPFSSHVLAMITQANDPSPKIETIAAQLNVSSRTLRRKLDSEGTSFRQLVMQLRHNNARYYLEKTSLSIEIIADLLGYSNAQNFTQAFRAWRGLAPSSYRKSISTAPKRA